MASAMGRCSDTRRSAYCNFMILSSGQISIIALQSSLDNGHTSSQNASAEVDQRVGVPKMKAIVIDDYGGVDQLHLRELLEPRPHADEVLVRVRTVGVNPVDWKIRQGQLRFILRPNFPYVPGGDIAGEVVAAGTGAAPFTACDPV